MRRKSTSAHKPLPLFPSTRLGPPPDVVIHTDGACSGNPGPGGWAAVVEKTQGFEELGGREEHTTNNRMEMRGVLEGLKRVELGERAHVVTDSRYLLDGITRWIHAWKRRGWCKADGSEVLNRDLWESLDALAQTHGKNLTWEHVRGHAGHDLNERCDVIATSFARNEDPDLRAGPGPWGGTLVPARGAKTASCAFPCYLSLVDGVPALHVTWAECEARVRGAGGARHRKIRSDGERQAALAAWGVQGE